MAAEPADVHAPRAQLRARAAVADAVRVPHGPPHQPMASPHGLRAGLEPPSLMLFACLTAPLANGATTLADAATILDALPIDLVDRFDRVGWQLVRTYNEDIGASLPEAFGTSDQRIIE